MSQRVIVTALIVAVAILGVALWFKQTSQQQSQVPAPQASSEPAGGEAGGQMPGMPPGAGAPEGESMGPGIAWTVPKRWSAQGERPMRVATYSVPAASGDPEPAECAVFHFGPNQGGGVDDNIARWVGQFENPSTPERSTQEIHGLSVARVHFNGTYTAPAGPNMAPTGQKAHYRLLGAIVSGPNGMVFFKLTGPEKTVRQAEREFDGLLQSLAKQ
jgi:hypothetical protein